MDWELAEATNRLDVLMSAALAFGPQRIVNGADVVVVLAEVEYERLIGNRATLTEHLLNGPGLSGLDLRRDTTTGREITL